MKKFFATSRSKPQKPNPREGLLPTLDDSPVPTPIYQQHAATASSPPSLTQVADPPQHLPTSQVPRNSSRGEDGRDHTGPYVSTPLGSPNMPPSPYHSSQASLIGSNKPRDRDTQSLRKSPQPNQPVVSNILRALEPPNVEGLPYANRSASEDGFSTVEVHMREPRDYSEKREKKGFWNWERNRDHDGRPSRESRRDFHHRREDEGAAELTKMIGYLTATASEDWALVLDVCDRVSANENNAREAVRALRREFKYGEPAGQLSAARLWAIMLRNCSDLFVSQSMNRKFLETIEELLASPKTSPVVRERLLDVIAAAAYASGAKKDGKGDRDGFRGLWLRVKPMDKPDEGMPFALDDAMFNPPVTSRNSLYGFPILASPEPTPPIETSPTSPPLPSRTHKKRKSPTRNRIIPHDEDVRRLLQECKIGQGNASVLSEALFHSKPETFKKDTVIREFYHKCRSSQELIFAQIPWATAEAEKSMLAREVKGVTGDAQEVTKEQQLLDGILAANGELLEALQQYEDMDRVAMERKAEYRSMKEVQVDRRVYQETFQQQNRQSLQYPVAPTSRSPSPSIRSPSPQHSLEPRRPHPELTPSTLAPPPPVPHGPRSPNQLSVHPRTPSPNLANSEAREVNGLYPIPTPLIDDVSYVDDVELPVQPSEKARGKQRAIEESTDSYSRYTRDSAYFDAAQNRRNSHSFDDSDHEDHSDPPWHRPIRYVYDAAAERNAERTREEYEQEVLLVNGVR